MSVDRINAFVTTPIVNVLESGAGTLYQAWLWERVTEAFDEDSAPIRARKRLGTGYQWQGSVRYWVWEGAAPVLVSGSVVDYRWRLFASGNGLTLEIETKGAPFGQDVKTAAGPVLQAFLHEWRHRTLA